MATKREIRRVRAGQMLHLEGRKKALILRAPYYLNQEGRRSHEAFLDLLLLADSQDQPCCKIQTRVPVRKSQQFFVLSKNETDRVCRRINDDLTTGHTLRSAALKLPALHHILSG